MKKTLPLILLSLLLFLRISVQASDIFDAIVSDNIDKVSSILSKSPDSCNQKDEFGRTPLQIAVRYGRIAMVKLFISRGADLNAKDGSGITPLSYTSLPYSRELSAHKEISEILISHGARLDMTDDNGFTPLHWAASGGRIGVTEVLISHGADINARDDSGNTPLHLAALRNSVMEYPAEHSKVVQLLLQKGADINVKNGGGETPLHDAVMGILKDEYTLTIEPIVLKGADINAKNNKGETPLHKALNHHDYLNVVKFLISKGANVNARDMKGKTPLKLAKERGFRKITCFLEKYGAKE